MGSKPPPDAVSRAKRNPRSQAGERETWTTLRAADDPLPQPPDVWLRIQRSGDALVGSFTIDGVDWREIDRKTFDPPLSEVLLVGVAVTSHCGATSQCVGPLEAELCEVRLEKAVGPGRPAFRRGDADSNGHVNLSDAVFTLRHLFHGEPLPSCPDSADVNDDGVLNLSDAAYLVSYLFRGGPPPTAPGGEECGPDGDEADGLGECSGAGCG